MTKEDNPLLKDDQRSFFLKSEYKFEDEWTIGSDSFHDILVTIWKFIHDNNLFLKRGLSSFYGTALNLRKCNETKTYPHYAVYRSWIDMLLTNVSNAIYVYVFDTTKGPEKVKEKFATAKMNEFKSLFR